MNRIPKATKGAFLVLALLVPAALAALFTNGGFETGDLTGWTKSTFLNPGLSGAPPFTGASIVRNDGGTDQTVTVTDPVPENGVDPRLGPTATLKFPKFGSFSARVNGPKTGQVSNTIKQQTTTTPSDVDPVDGRVHIRFAYAPVLQNPHHQPQEQPFYYVALRNITRGNALLYESLSFSNQPGVPWKTSPVDDSVLYTDWQIADIAPGSPALQVGDTVELEVTAADCSLGAHYGYVYVDGFGSQIPGLSVTKTATPSSVARGGQLTYNFVYRNSGSSAVSNVIVQEAVPADTTFVSVSDTTDCSYASGTVTCNFGTMSPGDQGTFSIVVAVSANPAGTSINNGNYTIEGTGVTATLGPLVTTPIQTLSISKTPSVPVVLPGGNLQYDFTYRNSGSSAVSNVIVQETVPADTTFVSVSDTTDCSHAIGTVTCNFGTMNPGDQGTFSIVVAVSANPAGTSIDNSNYTIEGTGVPATPGPPVTTPITGAPALSIAKTPSAAVALPGGELRYDFIYMNTGTAAANGVVVSETIPSETSFVSVSNSTACSHSNGVVTCDFGTLDAGASGTFSVVLKVASGAIGPIVNSTYSIAATGISQVAGAAVTVPVILPIPIPTISSLGILVLVSLLALSGFLLLVKRR